ncbi:MAG: L-threonylcarbamoyladenylate synthase [Chlamydiota bacterium]
MRKMLIDAERAIELLQAGEVVAIPTDTVYGLAADNSNDEAVEKIFTLKGRPLSNPLVTLIADISQLEDYVVEVPPEVDKLAKQFWPGALTIALPARADKVSALVRAGMPTAGFRVPAHEGLRRLLWDFGPVVAPSANPSGEDPALQEEDLERYFGQDFPIFEGGRVRGGVPSTVIGYSEGCWKIYREGAVSSDELRGILSF